LAGNERCSLGLLVAIIRRAILAGFVSVATLRVGRLTPTVVSVARLWAARCPTAVVSLLATRSTVRLGLGRLAVGLVFGRLRLVTGRLVAVTLVCLRIGVLAVISLRICLVLVVEEIV